MYQTCTELIAIECLELLGALASAHTYIKYRFLTGQISQMMSKLVIRFICQFTDYGSWKISPLLFNIHHTSEPLLILRFINLETRSISMSFAIAISPTVASMFMFCSYRISFIYHQTVRDEQHTSFKCCAKLSECRLIFFREGKYFAGRIIASTPNNLTTKGNPFLLYFLWISLALSFR